MNREQMIAQLAAAGPLDTAALGKLSDCQLRALSGAGAPATNSHDDPEVIAILQERVLELRRANEALEAEARLPLAAQKKERLRKEEDLIHNARTQFSDEQILGMDYTMLSQLYDTVFTQRHYGGRGGPRASNAGPSFDWVQPIMTGPAGGAALDRKEN
jgi:hypothetical protein